MIAEKRYNGSLSGLAQQLVLHADSSQITEFSAD
jgi:hypothetical protein